MSQAQAPAERSRRFIRRLLPAFIAFSAAAANTSPRADGPRLMLSCPPDADLFAVLRDSGVACERRATPGEAMEAAAAGSAVLILADGYPATPTQVDAALFDQARAKDLTLYVEYPASVPGLKLEAPRKTQWERVVVASDALGESLPRGRILMVHNCQFLPTQAADPWLVVGRVAGFDRAVFGLPKESSPLLFEIPDRRLFVATTSLSRFVTGRYAPTDAWRVFWQTLLARMTRSNVPELKFAPLARPAYGPKEKLPSDVERRSLAAFTRWAVDGKLLLHPSRAPELQKLVAQGAEMGPAPKPADPVGDGSAGLLEGFDSAIQPDGSQRMRLPVRADCHGEMALCFALDGVVNKNAESRRTAENLLDYLLFTSEAMRGVRGNPEHPSFGHIAWGMFAPAWQIANYGDDNARAIQGAIAAAACLGGDRWDEPIVRALLANLRTTGARGFRGERIDIAPMERFGWKHYREAPTVSMYIFAEGGMWACYLWAYARTGDREFLDRTKMGIRTAMEAYPNQWHFGANHLERLRMLHALVWLVRVEDTAEHRGWAKRLCDDLLACQDASGAIRTTLGSRGHGQGHYQTPTSNEEYGTREMPIIQNEGDPATDQLYETGFALSVLREAAAALGDPRLTEAEDKLADYVCRIQVRSERLPYLSGGWFRCFDYRRWDFWAGSGDAGWGAWSQEAGWAQAWGAATLGLRAMKTNLWDLTADSRVRLHLGPVRELMAVNKGGPWQPATRPAGG